MALQPLPNVGDQVLVHRLPARVCFVGRTGFADGIWIGVELVDAVGRNDGSVRGTRYFTCKPQHGLFVQPSHVKPAQSGPQVDDDQTALPTNHVQQWSALEKTLEAEALQAGYEGERVLKHIARLNDVRSPSFQRTNRGGAGAPRIGRTPSADKRNAGKTRANIVIRRQRSHVNVANLARTLPHMELPREYVLGGGPDFQGERPSLSEMEALHNYIKQTVGKAEPHSLEPVVPHKILLWLLLKTKDYLLREVGDNALADIQVDEGRIVLVGDTHGQLNDFLWILRAHGRPALDNIYLINGDVADRGTYAVEIFCLIFGYMLATPGSVYMNRGNHESLDMNIRGFNEGGGFAQEVHTKYDGNAFYLLQDVFNLMPLASRINKEALAIHGGLCRTNNATLEEINNVARVRPVPVCVDDPDDTLFFDCVWADPQEQDGFGRSEARGSCCVTFGPDVTRRFCEVNRLRMIIRSHEVPKSMSGVQVQHDGRLITIFSASNYCGRIGNTGGTMLISPQLDYQLMEHWAPSVAELLELDESEQDADAQGEDSMGMPSTEEPEDMQRRFSREAGRLMSADLVTKMKDLICSHKPQLLSIFEEEDPQKQGVVSFDTWVECVRKVLSPLLPWDEYSTELVNLEGDSTVDYRAFLSRYTVDPGRDGWNARLLGELHATLCKSNLDDTLSFFDQDQDGVVTVDELERVLASFSLGESSSELKRLSKRLLRGQDQLQTSELLESFQLEYRESTEGKAPRRPPSWAAPLLDTVSRQCAMRQRGSLELFQSFDTDGDGFISAAEFQEAMLQLGGYDSPSTSPEQRARVKEMLRDLADWVDRDGNGTINYLEFMSAFQLVGKQASSDDSASQAAITALNQIVESLCTFFYRHRWTLKHAFEYFDADGDGVVSPDEFSTAVKALAQMATEDGSVTLEVSDEAVDRLVASIDMDGDGFIDYDEFLHALQARDMHTDAP
ncbi:hypothetical protein AB1Y20_015929 [Prymnesium parvum]|uniref:Serine/threonine-protein phosphatase n=1 Tax=Prymnesium parvum TaxID=97485 RepID=A0AB34JYI4_PRYPA